MLFCAQQVVNVVVYTEPLLFLTLPFDCRTRMAHVEYAFPVEVIHGKVAKRHKIGFAHRKASKLNYTQSYSPRSTRYSQAEKDHQAKFAAVAAMVNARLADPNQMRLTNWHSRVKRSTRPCVSTFGTSARRSTTKRTRKALAPVERTLRCSSLAMLAVDRFAGVLWSTTARRALYRA